MEIHPSIFTTDFRSVNGLAFDPSSGTLYGSSGAQGSDPGSLFTVDLSLLETTFIGQTGVNNLAGISFQSPQSDHYTFFAEEGDSLQVTTSTPFDAPDEPSNTADPQLSQRRQQMNGWRKVT